MMALPGRASAAPACPGHVHISIAGGPLAIRVRVDGRARRVTLRLPVDAGPPVLTLPSARLLARGIAFAQSRHDWLAAGLARRRAAHRPFVPGIILSVGGRPLRLAAVPGRGVVVQDGRLEVGGDPALFDSRVQRWLVVEARHLLTEETRALAQAHGLPLGAVRVGDPKSRWGSCSANGTIAYSWRLLLAPEAVRRAVVAHEVAHLGHRNHGADFWRLAEHLLGQSHTPARQWLRRHGASLHGWGVSEG